MAVLVLMYAMTMMTACKNNEEPTPDVITITASVVKFHVFVSEDFAGYADITAEYYDDNGVVQKEVLKAGQWDKTVTAKLPSTHGLRMSAQHKEGATAKAAKYRCDYEYYYLLSDGTMARKGGSGFGSEVSFGSTEKLDIWFKQIQAVMGNILITYDEKGKITEGEWD